MLELIIDLSKYDDFAIVLKVHPRQGLLSQNKIMFDFIKNLKVVDSTLDTFRLTQWADIVVNGYYCSTILELIISRKM